ncbi:MAG TPA: EAL domain-containing protein [Polyangia bacterium]|nr:EAL domain-containing protein [Polyangia bacterium]
MTASEPTSLAGRTPPIRVLLVDDEPAVAKSLARLLAQAGHEVTTAADGQEALALVKSAAFEVIVSDVTMAGMDGLTLLRTIRGLNLDVPVVFMTGSPALEAILAAFEYGAFRYLMKPVDSQELLHVVERAAQMHRLALISRQAADAIAGRPIVDHAGLKSRFTSGLDKIWMAMQPVLSWSKREVFAYEALLRTEEPTLRNPLDFVDAAERLNCTDELGRRVRRKIADQLADLPPAVNLFVNLHPSDLVDEELCARNGALTPFASRVVLEVTERAALDKMPGLEASVTRLRQLGYRIALDDLGAGYAGLSSFALLEPEIVKVDMSLVRGIHKSPTKQKIFGAFTALCRDIDTAIVAEGVELAEERDCLNSLGGDLYQGYLFARPGRGFPVPVY